jgi:hypothetical protein
MDIDQPLQQLIANQKTGGRFEKNTQKAGTRVDRPYRSRNDMPAGRKPITNTSTSRECKFFNKPEGCQAINCGFEHRLIPGISFCQYYNTSEGCRRGNSCGFIHSPLAVPSLVQNTQPRVSSSIRSAPRQPQTQSHPANLPEGPRFRQLCHFFNSSGGCKVGSQCGFMHKEIKPFITECHFFNSEKGCTAEQCGFLHQTQNK